MIPYVELSSGRIAFIKPHVIVVQFDTPISSARLPDHLRACHHFIEKAFRERSEIGIVADLTRFSSIELEFVDAVCNFIIGLRKRAIQVAIVVPENIAARVALEVVLQPNQHLVSERMWFANSTQAIQAFNLMFRQSSGITVL